MSNVGEIDSVLFKQVASGHVFQAPNPWIFGPSNRYLVNDTQKAQLLAIITPRRPMRRVAVITVGIVLWTVAAATIVWALSPERDQPTGYELVAMVFLIVVPMFIALMIALQRNLRRMQPVLAGLPRTDERISRGDRRQAMAKTMSFRRALLIGATWATTFLLQIFILVMRNGRHPLFGDVESFMSVLMAIVAAGLAAYYLAIAIRKVRSQEST